MSSLPDQPGTLLPDGRYLWATTAIHTLGDISREEGDLCIVFSEDDTNWYGNWVLGFGFVHVRFPKETTRELNAEERNHWHGKPVGIAGSWSYNIDLGA